MKYKTLLPWIAVIGLLSAVLIIGILPSLKPETCEDLKAQEGRLVQILGNYRLNYSGDRLSDKEVEISNRFDELETKWTEKKCAGQITRPFPIIRFGN